MEVRKKEAVLLLPIVSVCTWTRMHVRMYDMYTDWAVATHGAARGPFSSVGLSCDPERMGS